MGISEFAQPALLVWRKQVWLCIYDCLQVKFKVHPHWIFRWLFKGSLSLLRHAALTVKPQDLSCWLVRDRVCFSCCCDRWSEELQLWRVSPSCCRWEISSWAQGEKYIFYRAWRGDMKSRGWGGGNEKNELCGTAVLSWQEGMTDSLHKARLSPANYLWIMEFVQSTALCKHACAHETLYARYCFSLAFQILINWI